MNDKPTKNIKKYKKQNAFYVPEDYFEEFNFQMQHSIGEENLKVSLIDRLIDLFHLRATIPLTLVSILAYLSILISQNEKIIDSYTYADAQAYFLSEVDLINDDELYDLTLGLVDSEENTTEQESVIDYLIDAEEMDLETIENIIN